MPKCFTPVLVELSQRWRDGEIQLWDARRSQATWMYRDGSERINGDRINGLFHLLINGIGVITHLLTIYIQVQDLRFNKEISEKSYIHTCQVSVEHWSIITSFCKEPPHLIHTTYSKLFDTYYLLYCFCPFFPHPPHTNTQKNNN